MPYAFVFLLGSALGFGIAAALLRRRRADVAPLVPVHEPEIQPPPAATRFTISLGDTDTLSRISEGIGSELADLATGVEGHAQLLCEVIGEPAQVASQAQLLWSAVRKLRLFSEKVLCSSGRPMVSLAPTDVGSLLSSLHHELEEYSGSGLRVTCATASSLPRARANRETLRRATLFIGDALLNLEPNASVLGLRASTCVSDDGDPSIEIEIRVESEDAPADLSEHKRSFALGYGAARNLIEALGAQLSLEHCPGLCSTARIHLAAAATDAAPEERPVDASSPHPFGGILVVADDPGVRTVVAREIEKTGRRIFSCPDGAAARSLLAATPERFELLILDVAGRRQAGTKLAADAIAGSPELKILWLCPQPRAGDEPPPGLGRRSKALHKPFGIIELREAVSELLDTPMPTQIGA